MIMKKILAVLIFSAMTTISSACAQSVINVENDVVTVTDAPYGSTLITAFYKQGVLSNVKLYHGNGTITADIGSESDGADMVKAFLWDMENITPITVNETESIMSDKIYIHVNDTVLSATLSDNSSAQAFAELLKNGPVTVDMSDYGGFEKVGPLGASLPRNDTSITTEPGDIILYQGNSITIYYDTNTWSFTRLGKIDNITQSQLIEILGDGDVTVTFSLSGDK